MAEISSVGYKLLWALALFGVAWAFVAWFRARAAPATLNAVKDSSTDVITGDTIQEFTGFTASTDNRSMYNATTGRVTIKYTGPYILSWKSNISTSANTATIGFYDYNDGTPAALMISPLAASLSASAMSVSGVVNLTKNQVIFFGAISSNAAGTITIAANDETTMFSVVQVA